MMRKVLILILGLFVAGEVFAAASPCIQKVGEDVIKAAETPHPVPGGAKGAAVWRDEFTHKGATYIAVHFSKFDLAPGESVTVASPDGQFSYTLKGKGRDPSGTFWATHIPGETAIVTYRSSGAERGWGYAVDKFARGYPMDQWDDHGAVKAICGADNSLNAVCYQGSEPEVYNNARAVARLLSGGSALCTAWLVGCDGHVMTNNHCLASQSDVNSADFEFMAQGAACGDNCTTSPFCPGTVWEPATPGTFIRTNYNADYTLVQLPANGSNQKPSDVYGFMRLRNGPAVIDERIYVPQHPAGWGKRIAVSSDNANDQSGFTEIATLNYTQCQGSGGPLDISYYADTQGGSSGSPVLAYTDHRVVSIHHCNAGGGACPNRGVPMEFIIADLQGAGQLPTCALEQYAGTVEFDAGTYVCDDVVSIEVIDDHLIGQPSHNVTIVSGTEATPETVTLVPLPAPNQNTFIGSIALTTDPVTAGNGVLSVVDGDTITVTYVDADDGQGGVNVPRTGSAAIDCIAPIITNVGATNVTGNSALINWLTNEPATSIVRFGLAPPPGSTASSGALVLTHGLTITGLQECSTYYYEVASQDDAGNYVVDNNGGAYYTLQTGKNVSPSFLSTDTPIAIPDNNAAGATSTIAVTDTQTVLEVKVQVNITHTFDGDLSLSLVAPNGTVVPLSTRRGSSGDNFTNTLFDDAATTAISAGVAPFTGSFKPETPLAAATGIPATGNWQLKVVDSAGIDVGTIDNWTLYLRYPAAACGPHAKFSAKASVADACSSGGPGAANGIWDAGETVDFSVTVENDGTVALTGVTATLTATTPGVTMAIATASYPAIPVTGTAVSDAPHFRAVLPAGLACGGTVGFDVEVTSDQGTWTSPATPQGIGLVILGGGTVLDENFSAGIPATWSIVDGGSGGGAAATWTTANPGARTAAAPITAPFAIVDSDNAGSSSTQDEELITPVMDLSPALTVTLEFDQYLRRFGTEKGDVDVRSSLTAGAWVNVFSNTTGSTPNPEHKTLNITAQAAGAADVQVRFHYYDAGYEWWWQVDNVKVTYTAPGGCNMNVCAGGPAGPPPVPDGTFGQPLRSARALPDGSSIDLTWDVATCTAADYHLVYGPLASVSTYTVSGGGCDMGTGGTHSWTSVPAGDLWYVIVSDDDASVEGSWGRTSSGAERNGATSSGHCSVSSRNNSATCP